jgi:hypothetical protein
VRLRVVHVFYVSFNQSATNANILGIDRINFGDDERLRCGDSRHRFCVDDVRRIKIEIQREQGRASFQDDEVVTFGKPDVQFGLPQRIAFFVDNSCCLRATRLFDKNFGVRIIETDLAGYVIARWYRCDADELGQVHVLCEINASTVRQYFDYRAVTFLEFE